MGEQIQSENRSALAAVSASISFPYIWLGLFLLLSLLYGGNFFGQNWEGDLVAGLLCLGLLNPIVPGLVANFIARPIFLNLLGRELISTAGCLIGLVGFALTGLGVLYFLGRDLRIALIVFLAAPVVGVSLCIAITTIQRGRFPSASSRSRYSPSTQIRGPRRGQRSLPRRTERPVPTRSQSRRLPTPRRSDRTKRQSNKRVPPPRKRK